LFFFALLIGLVNDSLSQYMDELQSGTSRVLVDNHTVILGSSAKLKSILRLLNKDVDSKCTTYVVLGDEKAEQMVQQIEIANGRRIIFRRGDPSKEGDVLKTRPSKASSIILLSPEAHEVDEESDIQVMARAMMVRTHNCTAPIVTEIRDKDSFKVVHEMLRLDDHNDCRGVIPIAGDDIAGSLMVQAALQPGLSKVVHHLLDYEFGGGNEVYFVPVDRWPHVIGRNVRAIATF